MSTTAADNAFRERIEHAESLIRNLERDCDPATRARLQEIVQTLLDFHGTGLARIVDHLRESGTAGEAVLDRLAQDELVASLLLLYDLHPLGIEARVRQALERVRPYLKSHGGSVDLLGIHDGVVQLRLEGSCHGCGSSAATVKQLLEEAVLAAAPEITRVEAEGVASGVAPAAAFVSVDELVHRSNSKQGSRPLPVANPTVH